MRAGHLTASSFLAVVFMLVLSSGSASGQVSWVIERPDSLSGTGLSPSIASDAFGNPHIVGGTNWEAVRYSRRIAGTWQTETIPGGEFDSYGTDASCDLALDSQGAAHVVLATNDYCDENNYYYGYPCRFINYFTNASGSWRQEERYYCTRGSIGSTAIAVDSTGYPAIAYSLFGPTCIPVGLWYAYPPRAALAAWTHEKVDDTPGTWGKIALAFDAVGRPHICYDHSADVQTPAASLKYAFRSAGTWQKEIVENPSGWFSRYPSLAMDASGNVHIAYYETTQANLVYASRRSGVWTKEIVDADGDVGRHTAISVDAAGESPSIAYQGGTSELRYAFKRGGEWMTTIVDTTGDAGRFTALALDFTGIPQVAYWADGLRYARATSLADPEPTSVDIPNAPEFELFVFPNPSRIGHTDIRLVLSPGVRARLDVLDVSGRRVRTLVSDASRGSMSLTWDGLDDRARSVAAGSYFIRAEVDGKAAVRHVQIVR